MEMDAEKELKLLWRNRKILMQMCNDRNYLVTEAELNQTLEQFRAQFGSKVSREDLTILMEHMSDPSDKMYIFFPEDLDVKLATVKSYFKRLQHENIKHAIIVARLKIAKTAKQALLEKAPHYTMEYFLADELLVNITEHAFVPKHVALTPEEKEKLLKDLKSTESQLPKIRIDDAVSRYYAFQRGQVIKILRYSEEAGHSIYYRLVV